MLEERQIDVEDIEQEIDTVDGRKSYVCYVNALTLDTHDFILQYVRHREAKTYLPKSPVSQITSATNKPLPSPTFPFPCI